MRRTIFVVLALVSLSACDLSDPEPAADPTPTSSISSTVAPATPATRPRAERCYAFTYADAVASTTDVKASSCKKEHTAVTFYVGTVDAVVDGHLLAIDSEQVRADIAAQCPRRLGRYLGGSEEDLRLSMFRTVWFSPTIEQSDEGQDWYRCDVIALARDEKLAPLGRGLEGALDEEGSTDRYGMCGTADPEDAEFQRVICSADHTWRAIATVNADGKAYPGGGELRAAGRTACEDPARALAPDPLTVTWSYEPPTRKQWNAGQHFGLCWVPTS